MAGELRMERNRKARWSEMNSQMRF